MLAVRSLGNTHTACVGIGRVGEDLCLTGSAILINKQTKVIHNPSTEQCTAYPQAYLDSDIQNY